MGQGARNAAKLQVQRGGSKGRIKRDNAVEVFRPFLDHGERFAATGRAACKIFQLWALAIMAGNQVLGRVMGFLERFIGKVFQGLLVQRKLAGVGRIVSQLVTGVTAVGGVAKSDGIRFIYRAGRQ